jgi:DNA-binding NarL/FixJ family response regulator
VDLVVLDLGLPDRPGLEVLKDLKAEYPDLPVMILSVSCPDQVALRAIRSGAAAYLAKDCPPDELVRAVRTVLERGHYLTRDVSQLLLEHTQRPGDERTGHQRLSDREYQILLALGRGETQRAIGDREGISPKTVSTYRTRILEKLALRTTADLVRYCLENRLLDADSMAQEP